MHLRDVLFEIAERGITLSCGLSEDRLNAKPTSALTPELIAEIKEHKMEIIEIMREDEKRRRKRSEQIIQSEAEVFELARERFGVVRSNGSDQSDPRLPRPPRRERQEKMIEVRFSEEEWHLVEQIAQSRDLHRLSVEAQFAKQHPELWEEIRAELQKFNYYNTNGQRILEDPEFCEQAMEDLGLIRESFEEATDTPEEFRSLVAQGIEFVISEYYKAAGKWGSIEWGRISWRPDTGLDLRKETNY